MPNFANRMAKMQSRPTIPKPHHTLIQDQPSIHSEKVSISAIVKTDGYDSGSPGTAAGDNFLSDIYARKASNRAGSVNNEPKGGLPIRRLQVPGSK